MGVQENYSNCTECSLCFTSINAVISVPHILVSLFGRSHTGITTLFQHCCFFFFFTLPLATKLTMTFPKFCSRALLRDLSGKKKGSVTSMAKQEQDHRGKNRKHRRKTSQCILFLSRKQEGKMTNNINISAQNLFLQFEFSSDDDRRPEALEFACFVLSQRHTQQELACSQTPGSSWPSLLLCLQLKRDFTSLTGKEAGRR